ncbi:MAG TPA: ABC transporter permease [Kofleriaceae bacterium]|nr:ABC transporter permease [Kofleriaceae bacterium]
MIRFVLKRLGAGLVVVFFAATIAFFMLKAAPGGPFDEERAVPPEVKRNIEKRYHLDWSVPRQYLNYMDGLMPVDLFDVTGDSIGLHWGGFKKPDLGHSMKRTQTVQEIIEQSFPVSARLGLMALFFASVAGIFLGVLAASRHNTWGDHTAMGVALLGISIPSFVLGPILIMVFALGLKWLPPAQFTGFSSLVLPGAALGMIYMGTIARLSRGGMLEILRQDYIRTARAKGVSERKVVWKHGVRLGLMPVVTYLGPAAAHLVAGTFVIEQIFQLPGLGFYFIASITDRDYPLLCGLLVFYSFFLILFNLVVDLAYGFLDPRIRSKR